MLKVLWCHLLGMRFFRTSIGCSTSPKGALCRKDLGREWLNKGRGLALASRKKRTGLPWRVPAGQRFTCSCLETLLSACKAEPGMCLPLNRLRSPGREALMALCLHLVVHFFVSSSCGQFLLGQLCPLCRFGILPQTVSTVSRLWLLLSPTVLWLCRRLQVS